MTRAAASLAIGGMLSIFALASIRFGVAAWPFDEDGPIPTLAPLLSQVTPAVVNVAIIGRSGANPLLDDRAPPGDPPPEDPLRRFFGAPEQPRARPQQSIGSGVIVDGGQGLIVTNHHVVQDAQSIVVTLSDRRQFDATVVGSDAGTDIALLRIDPADQELSAIEFGDSDELEVGDFVVAIGNPFGLGQTATSGIVSALGRSGINVEGYEDFIQTDASINPGNSGGALIGLDGKLLGVNTAIISSLAGGNIGIGFAIPSNMAEQVIDQLVQYGEVRRGRLGVVIQDVTPGLAEALQLDVEQGALVTQVEPGSPAEQIGVEVGDVILEVNDDAVQSSTDLRNEIGLIRTGEAVSLTLMHQGMRKTVRTTVAEPPVAAVESEPPAESLEPGVLDGVELSNLPPEHPLFGNVQGVLVVRVQQESAAWRQGLMQNDVVTAVNRMPVASVDELSATLGQIDGPVALHVQRGSRQLFVLIE